VADACLTRALAAYQLAGAGISSNVSKKQRWPLNSIAPWRSSVSFAAGTKTMLSWKGFSKQRAEGGAIEMMERRFDDERRIAVLTPVKDTAAADGRDLRRPRRGRLGEGRCRGHQGQHAQSRYPAHAPLPRSAAWLKFSSLRAAPNSADRRGDRGSA